MRGFTTPCEQQRIECDVRDENVIIFIPSLRVAGEFRRGGKRDESIRTLESQNRLHTMKSAQGPPPTLNGLERLLFTHQSSSAAANLSARRRFSRSSSQRASCLPRTRELRQVLLGILTLLFLSTLTLTFLHQGRLGDTLATVCKSHQNKYGFSKLCVPAQSRTYGEPEGDGLPFIPLMGGPVCERTLLISLDGNYGMGSTFTLLLVSLSIGYPSINRRMLEW